MTPTRLDRPAPGGDAGVTRARLITVVREALEVGGVLLTAGPGYGKTTVLEQALSDGTRRVAWLSCTETERAEGTLLMRILDRVGRVAPGATDALAERLASAPEQVDAIAAARELVADLPRLLVDPLVLVIDDAEHLDGADRSLELLGELIGAALPAARVAVASRRPLGLHVAKVRASGRLAELGPADLAFDSEECAALLLERMGREPSAEEVGDVLAASEGWPLGIALATGRGPGNNEVIRGLRSAPEVRAFLSEELLDSLTPDLRAGAITSSVTRVVTPGVALALELPGEFGPRIDAAGMLVRHEPDGETFTYHPLLREFLYETLVEEHGEEELRRLHALVAPAVAAGGDPIAATEHWLEAQSWDEAVAAIVGEGPNLARSSPELLRRWLAALPPEVRALPSVRVLAGQLDWASGAYPEAAEALQAAIQGFAERPDPVAEWHARFVLADTLFALGEFGRVAELAEGWDDPAAAGAGVLAPATVAYVAVALAAIGDFEQSDRLAALAAGHPDAALLGPVETLRLAFRDTPPGHLDALLESMKAAVDEIQRFDPFNRRLYFIAGLALMYAERGLADEALETWMRVREGAHGGGGTFLVDTTHAWCALLHTEVGRLQEAEAEFAPFQGLERGWRSYVGDLATACLASLRGDAEVTLAAGDAALATVGRGPILFRYWTAAHLVPALAAVGRQDRAWTVLNDAFDMIDDRFPAELGVFPRGRLLALRSWLRHLEGDDAGADEDLVLFWDEAGETLRHTLRREWRRLGGVVWSALERGALSPEPAFLVLTKTFPDGLELVPFLEHPNAAVRRAALAPAAESGDPKALAHLAGLADDPDQELAGAASDAMRRMARILPPLRYELLGRFGVGRGAWRAGDTWERPVDARLMRFLLVNLDRPVPEDAIFEALWPDLAASGARKSLQVAVSRARRVIDPPGTECSAIESVDRTYRLILGERDGVDAETFRAAAEIALAETNGERRALLEHARSLWGGEPLPEERYADWTTDYRERLIDRYTAVLAALVGMHEAAGEHVEAADVARELVDLDDLNEGGHRALMTAYARSGRTGYALRQYLECRRALVEQIGIEPSEETSRLQARILAGQPI